MAWQDRIREAAYRSPSGIRTVFIYENVERTVEKKTTAFDFPDTDGTLVQDLGHKGRRYPLRIFFTGDNHDLEAAAFEKTLLEKGVGVLEHPTYGTVDVVPFGEIKQRDDLKTRANQSVFEVTFFATLGAAYPTATSDGPAEVLTVNEDYNAAAAAELEEGVIIADQFEEVTFRDQYNGFLDSVEDNLAAVAETQKSIEQEFNAINDSINRGIDVLIAEPLTLAFQTLALIKAPARAVTQIQARLDGYSNLASSILAGGQSRISTDQNRPPQTISPTNDNRAPNELASRKLFAQGAVSGQVESTMLAVQNGGYNTQAEAISAAEQLLDLMDTVTDWTDDNYRQLDGTTLDNRPVVDTGGAYQKLQEAVARAAGELIDASFGLATERRFKLDKPRALFSIVGQYYGNVDEETLDFFINTNDLTGSEILEVPRGREVVVYV